MINDAFVYLYLCISRKLPGLMQLVNFAETECRIYYILESLEILHFIEKLWSSLFENCGLHIWIFQWCICICIYICIRICGGQAWWENVGLASDYCTGGLMETQQRQIFGKGLNFSNMGKYCRYWSGYSKEF